MSAPLRVLIADDELLARKRLQRLLGALEEVEVVGECASGEDVLERVRQGGVDLVLLDIQMPGLTGVEAMALWPEGGPAVVYCTAHPDHALEAFDQGAVDYLLKPIEPGRLQKAVERARARRPVTEGGTAEPGRASAGRGTGGGGGGGGLSRLAIPTRQGVVLVDPAVITHALLADELVTVYTLQGKYLTDFTLQELESRLPPDRFQRVHRRVLLNLEHVTRLEPLETGGYVARTAQGLEVEVSRQAARGLRRRLGLRKGPGDDEG